MFSQKIISYAFYTNDPIDPDMVALIPDAPLNMAAIPRIGESVNIRSQNEYKRYKVVDVIWELFNIGMSQSVIADFGDVCIIVEEVK